MSIQWIRIYLCVIEFQRQGFHSRGHMPRKFSEERIRKEMIDRAATGYVFGADAWFTEKEVEEVVEFAKKMEIRNN